MKNPHLPAEAEALQPIRHLLWSAVQDGFLRGTDATEPSPSVGLERAFATTRGMNALWGIRLALIERLGRAAEWRDFGGLPVLVLLKQRQALRIARHEGDGAVRSDVLLQNRLRPSRPGARFMSGELLFEDAEDHLYFGYSLTREADPQVDGVFLAKYRQARLHWVVRLEAPDILDARRRIESGRDATSDEVHARCTWHQHELAG